MTKEIIEKIKNAAATGLENSENSDWSHLESYEEILFYLDELQDEISKIKTKSTGRKLQVLEVLKSGKHSIKEIAAELGITDKNVSSQLTYLRTDGYKIYTDHNGRKFLSDGE